MKEKPQRHNRKCQHCFTRCINLCCKQLKICSTFQSAFSKNTFLIRHNATCKSSCVIYLFECCLCEKSQHVGKSEYSLNLRINTHRHDVWRTDGPPCDKHFQMPVHNFNVYGKFAIIEKVCNKSLSKLKIRSLLEHREDFWILKLQTLSPQGLNISLNYPQDTLDPFGSHFKTRFHTPFCSFHSLSNLLTWMSYTKLI